MDSVKSLVTDSATEVYVSLRPESFTMADLGCSSGANALGMVEETIRRIAEVCRAASPSQTPPEFSILLNDLPTNDFNTIFLGFPDFAGKVKADNPLVFLSGVPGSFCGRLFHARSVHFVCSFSSLHWLSQVPLGVYEEENGHINKGKMFISSTSPPAVQAVYMKQFQRDFSLFLMSRAAEVVPGGRMVLSMLGRETDCCTDSKTTLLWDLLSDSLAALVEQGLVEQGKVDATTCRSTRRAHGRSRKRCARKVHSAYTTRVPGRTSSTRAGEATTARRHPGPYRWRSGPFRSPCLPTTSGRRSSTRCSTSTPSLSARPWRERMSRVS